MTWKADFEEKPWSGERNLRIWRAFPDRIEVLQPFQFKSYDRHTKVPDDEIALADHYDTDEGQAFLQAILDLAWSHGLRPKSFEDHNNELKAVRYHLEDMRRLAMAEPARIEVSGRDLDMREVLRPR